MLGLLPASLHRALYRAAFGVRHHFRRIFKLPIFGVGIVLRDGDGRVMLVQHSYGPQYWALPGGGHGRREDPAAAVRREIEEELALEIAELELVEIFEERLSGAPHRSSLFTGIALGEPRPDLREVVAVRYFAREELPEPLAAATRKRLDLWFRHDDRRISVHHNNDS